MSFFAEYVREREGKDVLETDYGFAKFVIAGERVWIEDIYVRPSSRRTGCATEMADAIAEIAKKAGCKCMLGTVDPSASGATESMKTLLAYGMKLDSMDGKLIWFAKDL